MMQNSMEIGVARALSLTSHLLEIPLIGDSTLIPLAMPPLHHTQITLQIGVPIVQRHVPLHQKSMLPLTGAVLLASNLMNQAPQMPKKLGLSEASSNQVMADPQAVDLDPRGAGPTWVPPKIPPALPRRTIGGGQDVSRGAALLVRHSPNKYCPRCSCITLDSLVLASSSTPPTPQMSRRKLELLPRSNAPSAVPSPLSSPNPSNTPMAPRSNPFGAAK